MLSSNKSSKKLKKSRSDIFKTFRRSESFRKPMTSKPAILFVSEPNRQSELYQTVIKEQFQAFHYTFLPNDPAAFLKYLHDTFDQQNVPLAAIYGGYPSFSPIGGLTRDIIEHQDFPSSTLQCIVLCSRGVNGIDFDSLAKNGIKLFNYDDEILVENANAVNAVVEKPGLVGNDVADCALWHVMEGFRKFSLLQQSLRQHADTISARFLATGKDSKNMQYSYGHELTNCMVRSPRGQKVLILGLGSIGKQTAYKLQHGLGMEVHYAKRVPDTTVAWTFHKLDDTLLMNLAQFSTIVVALPGTPETQDLVNDKFLSYCSKELILVNIGRGSILHQASIDKALQENRIRHLGIDVFHEEPKVSRELLDNVACVTVTPHVASGRRRIQSKL